MRTQRRSDGTVSIKGVRFEVPGRYRHMERLSVRYASWDLGRVHIADARTGNLLAPMYPLDRAKNADGLRRVVGPVAGSEPDVDAPTKTGMAPLLRQLITAYDRSGLPPPYLPKDGLAQVAALRSLRAARVSNILRKYLGFTWKAALDAHATDVAPLKVGANAAPAAPPVTAPTTP